jgi:mannose-6-phosphate isomerase-like protein (cupin superfamily)
MKNTNYRKVIHPTPYNQLVLMSLEPNEYIKEEIHPHTTQFIRVEEGKIVVEVDGNEYDLEDGDAINIAPGTKHAVRNESKHSAKLYTIYSPPEHPSGLVQKSQF